MKMIVAILVLLISRPCWSQRIEVIVPTQPVVVGTAFQVQYIVTNPDEFVAATTPAFDSCRLVSGPNIYKGTTTLDGKTQPIQNIAYTLVPTKTGVLRIGGIRVSFKNLPDEQSADAGITVVPQPRASFSVRSSYTEMNVYAPSSKKDLEKLVDENLFIKTEVNRKTCYEGEPVVATFKLYSRLQSSSEAERSPAFYGFSVVDILNINEAHAAVETVNGKIYNTSVLRQVQLYPVQAGRLVIDPMYVHNEIEFDDSVTHAKTKLEKEIVTEPIVITVKPLPAKRPDDFTGAVGRFFMEVHLLNKEIAANGQGKLVVRIHGKGNFIQFGQPVVQWPGGVEPFEAAITDKLNKNTAPIEGQRTYEFGFAADSAGHYVVAPFSFSYFDVEAGTFKTLATDSLLLHVTKAMEKNHPRTIETKRRFSWFFVLIALGVLATVLILRRRKQQSPAMQIEKKPAHQNYQQQIASIDIKELNEKQVYLEIQKILSELMKENSPALTVQQKDAVNALLNECQLLIYSHMEEEGRKEELVERALKILQR